MALTSVPSGVDWFTPVNEIDDAVMSVATGPVTTTL
jgi:hypothetical protein